MIYISLTFFSAVCQSCAEERLEEERKSQLDYDRAVIYVRQISFAEKNGNNGSDNAIGGASTGSLDVSSTSAGFLDHDPDFVVHFFDFRNLNNILISIFKGMPWEQETETG